MTEPRQRSSASAQSPATWDVVATSVLTVTLIAASLLSSLGATMIEDSCTTSCNDALISAAHLTYWGGFAAAVLVAVVGAGWAAAKDCAMVVGPIFGWAVFAAAWTFGGFLVEAAGS